jgi:hypothetical protein
MPMEDTEIIKKPESGIATDSSRNGDSHIFKISIRAWIALIFVATVCYMSVFSVKQIEEPLYSLATLAVGFYFGQKAQIPK